VPATVSPSTTVPVVNPNTIQAINPTVIVTRMHGAETVALTYLHLWGPKTVAVCLVAAVAAYLLGLLGSVKGLRRLGVMLAIASLVVYVGGSFLLRALLTYSPPRV